MIDMNTDTNTNSIQYTNGAPLAPDDMRTAMARALQAARSVIEQLDEDNADNATPCEGWTALDVARHLVTVFRKAVVAPTGADLLAFPEIAAVDLGSIVAAVDDAAVGMHAAWSDDATLATMIDAPWGTMPGAAVLGVWSGETLVHTWDLVVSIGVELTWPEPDTSINLEAAMEFLPESGRPDMVPFDDAVVLADDRAPIDRLAGWMGRDVDAWR
jgi:uncharacterized protein (TIGR03086 family)